MQLVIRAGNRNVKITVDVAKPSDGGKGGDAPGDAPSETGSGEPPSYGCCCAPFVIGPIVVSGSRIDTGTGGDAPGDVSSETGSGKGKGKGGDGPGDASSETGSGSSSDGCCCAPMVIGPIVLTDCCDGHSTTSSVPTTPKPVSVKPPQVKGVPFSYNPPVFVLQKQEQSNWCWAAVAVSVNDFLNPTSTGVPTWTQDTLATRLLNDESPGAGLNCSMPAQAVSTHACNRPERLDAALTITGNMQPKGFLAESFLTFDAIRNWVNAGIPVCARIAWRGSGAHFIVIDGCSETASGRRLVHVQDPLRGVAPAFWDYDALRDSYDQTGIWHDSYLLTR